MSWKATAIIKEWHDGITRTEKLILMILADYQNPETGQCNPSLERLSYESLTSKTHVITIAHRLEEKGCLKIITGKAKGKQLTNQYVLNLTWQGQLSLPGSPGQVYEETESTLEDSESTFDAQPGQLMTLPKPEEEPEVIEPQEEPEQKTTTALQLGQQAGSYCQDANCGYHSSGRDYMCPRCQGPVTYVEPARKNRQPWNWRNSQRAAATQTETRPAPAPNKPRQPSPPLPPAPPTNPPERFSYLAANLAIFTEFTETADGLFWEEMERLPAIDFSAEVIKMRAYYRKNPDRCNAGAVLDWLMRSANDTRAKGNDNRSRANGTGTSRIPSGSNVINLYVDNPAKAK